MKKLAVSGMVLLLSVLALPLLAGNEEAVTVSGEVMCAKCTLKADGATSCQDVLVTKSEDGETMVYYIASNDVAKEAGHVCKSKRAATITGKLMEKDGKTWIEPSAIEFS